MLPDAVVSDMVTLIPLTPETAECVSQSLEWSLVLDMGEAESMLISAAPSSLLALLVIGAEMLCASCGLSLCRRCGMGNLNLVVPPMVRVAAEKPRIPARRASRSSLARPHVCLDKSRCARSCRTNGWWATGGKVGQE